MIIYASKENNLGPGDKISSQDAEIEKGPIFRV